MIQKRKKWLCIAFGLLAAFGVYDILNLAGFPRACYSILFCLLPVLFIGLYNRTLEKLIAVADLHKRKRRIIYGGIISFFFALSMIAGYQLQNGGMTDGGLRGKAFILLRTVLLGIALFPFSNCLIRWCGEKLAFAEKARHEYPKGYILRMFGICAGATFLCLIPVWLAYYPIVMSYDFHRQINEAYKGFAWFYPYQPIAHTWVIWVFMKLGQAVGSYEKGMACMALFQILLYSLTTGYADVMILRITGKKRWMAVATAFFAVFPFCSVLVVCTTKDVLFTVLFLLFFLLFVERNFLATGKRKWVLDVLLVLEGCLMMQFRNNAYYAVAVFSVLMIIFSAKKDKLRFLILCLALTFGGKGMQIAIREAIGTEIPAPAIEMYSVPIQQFARVGYLHEQTLDDDMAILIDKYVPMEKWCNYYAPLADSVKVFAKEESFQKWSEFLPDWFQVFRQFPNECLDAFLELTRGYWFLDDISWTENLGSGTEGRMGAVFTYNSSEIEGYGEIVHESKLPLLEKLLEQVVSANAFYRWPVISVLFRSAFYTWMLFLVMLLLVYRKQWKVFRVGLLPSLYLGTMLLGPVVQIRYLFPIMSILPVMLAMLQFPISEKVNVEQSE